MSRAIGTAPRSLPYGRRVMQDPRPCRSCQAAKCSCSLTAPGQGTGMAGRCTRCERMGIDCVLAKPRKRACTCCRKVKERCTWEKAGSGSGSRCDRCCRLNLECVHHALKQRRLVKRPAQQRRPFGQPTALAQPPWEKAALPDIEEVGRPEIHSRTAATMALAPVTQARDIDTPAARHVAAATTLSLGLTGDSPYSGAQRRAEPPAGGGVVVGRGYALPRRSRPVACTECAASKTACVGDGDTCDRCQRL
eukprot:COSAG01_NODE_10320_length_2193_cov_30.918338_1_plen_249_part_10